MKRSLSEWFSLTEMRSEFRGKKNGSPCEDTNLTCFPTVNLQVIQLPPKVKEYRPRIRSCIVQEGGIDAYSRYHETKQLLVSGVCHSKAEIAKFLKVSRARVTQLFHLDGVADSVWEWLRDYKFRAMVSERQLRRLVGNPADKQLEAIKTLCSWGRMKLA